MKRPGAYREGFERSRAANPELAERSVGHTHLGDPLADAMIADPAEPGRQAPGRRVWFVLHGGAESALRAAPASAGKASNLTAILDVTVFDREGIRLELPDDVHSGRSSGWQGRIPAGGGPFLSASGLRAGLHRCGSGSRL